jgi:beta-lactamase class A
MPRSQPLGDPLAPRVTRTRCLGLAATLATLLLLGMSPLPFAAAQTAPYVPNPCNDAPVTPPPDTERVTWEYIPPITGGSTRLLCASKTLAALIDQAPGDWGIAVRDLHTRETLLANPDQHFTGGSLYKLGVAAEAYARIDDGALAEQSVVLVSNQDVDPEYGGSMYAAGTYLSVHQAVEAMLTHSDNGAALALVDRLGLNAVNLRFAQLGMPETRLVINAVTTPRDMLSYFTLLADGGVVSIDVSDSLIQLLAAQTINDRIPAGLPPGEGWWVAHKTANVDDMLGDAGIVHAANDDEFALIILNQRLTSYLTAIQSIRSISAAMYRALVPLPGRAD